MFTKISVAALFAGLAAAYHQPVGEPNGNAITRPLNEVVPSCKSFTITWTPSTTNPVSLLLLQGPSNNVVPIATIVEGIPNSGSFVWTPPAGLTPSTGPNGYGIQLIDDTNGQYQYSTQFGISNNDAACAVKVSSGAASGSASVPAPSKPASASGSAPVVPTSPCSTVTITTYVKPSVPASTGGVPATVIQPTKPMSVPASLKNTPTASYTGPVLATGAASNVKAGLGLVGGVAALAFML